MPTVCNDGGYRRQKTRDSSLRLVALGADLAPKTQVPHEGWSEESGAAPAPGAGLLEGMTSRVN